jgi:hypothetical protein
VKTTTILLQQSTIIEVVWVLEARAAVGVGVGVGVVPMRLLLLAAVREAHNRYRRLS